MQMDTHKRRRRWATPLLLLIVVLAALAGTTYYKQQRAPDGSAGSLAPSAAGADSADAAQVVEPLTESARREQMTPVAQQAIAGIVASRVGQQSEGARRNASTRLAAAATYAAETSEPRWAAAKENELQAVITGNGMVGAGVAAQDLALDCKRTMCRLQASFPDSSAADDWVLAYMSSVGSALQKSVVSRADNPDGSIGVVILSKAR